jgi:hypothetical protein
MSNNYCALYSPDGVHLGPINEFIYLDCTLAEMQVGALVLVVPGVGRDAAQIPIGSRVAYYRAPVAGLGNGIYRLVGQTTWIVMRRQRLVNNNYEQLIRLTCLHPNVLLSSRVIAYDEATAEADKTAAADDMIKAYVRENFLTATDSARNLAAARFAVEADTGDAPSIMKAASYRTVLPTLQEIAAAAATAGTYTGFEMYSPTETGAFTLRTYTGQRGTDRSSTGVNPLVLTLTRGSLNSVELDEDYTEMISAVYAGGSGKKDERIVSSPALDTSLIATFPYGRFEWFQSVSAVDDTAVLDDEAARVLREKRPRVLFTGDVRDTEYATFGEEYDWGDRVIGEYTDLRVAAVSQYDCRVDPVRITIERQENQETGMFDETETLDIRLRGEA